MELTASKGPGAPVEERFTSPDMNRARAQAFHLLKNLDQGIPIDIGLFPMRTASVEAVTAGRCAVIVCDHTTGAKAVYNEIIGLSSHTDPTFF